MGYEELKEKEETEKKGEVIRLFLSNSHIFQSECQEKVCECQHEIRQLEVKILDLCEELETKVVAVPELKEEIALKKPLFQVGVDIRKGCLEKSRVAEYNGYTADKDIIEKRNIAAHEGNWIADASLYHFGYISLESFDRESDLFNLRADSYGLLPDKFGDMHGALKAGTFPIIIINCINVMFTILVARRKTHHPYNVKKVCFALIQSLVDLWNTGGIGGNVSRFSEDGKVLGIVAEVEDLRNVMLRPTRRSSVQSGI
ncbi:uncharacterized protein RAG0_08007 [Rhynchosporium agropyri]|uniref:Uncharacterized protein n=1 Tax=Rhynchosporium agropyri TaxID=914238 RepID=A0A1E1KNV7_9HELO|nr:uncharacterized protein RAG0_08007 [Rhynchosporium agropyri]